MPNHTQNIVSIETNTNVQEETLALQELKTDLKIKEGKFDFNGIIPMPKELEKGATLGLDVETGERIEHKDYVLEGGVYKPKHRLARKRLMIEYGCDNWYDFSRLHWGTKWNSYEVEVLQDEDWTLFVSFLTAWDSPRGIAEKIKAYCNQHHLHLDWTAEHEDENGIEQIA